MALGEGRASGASGGIGPAGHTHVPVSSMGRPVTLGEGGASQATWGPTATIADEIHKPHNSRLSGAKPSSHSHYMLNMSARPVAARVNPTLPRLSGAQLFLRGLKAYYTQNPNLCSVHYTNGYCCLREPHTPVVGSLRTPHFQAVRHSAFPPWAQGLLHAEPRPLHSCCLLLIACRCLREPHTSRLSGAQLFFHGLKAYYTQNPDLAAGQQKGDLTTRKGRKQAAKQV